MFDSLYAQIDLNEKYQVWYTTIKRGLKKCKSFNDMEEVMKWCKSNKNKVTVNSGSWQVLDAFKEVNSK